MYGLLLENLAEYIKSVYGDEKWEEIRREAGISSTSFGTHTDFDESLLIFLAETAQEILGIDEREFMDQMGVYFVEFVGQYGYDRVLSVLGRHVRDFLNGLDNLHEYLKFSYPLMRAPSFICENENRHGLTLHYRTKRKGFVYYTMGQIREVARHFYHKDMQIDLIKSDLLGDTCHYTFNLAFDNRAFSLATLAMTREEKHLPISAAILFEIFPFCIVFGADMVVRSIGNSLLVILPDLVGKKIIAWFSLKRPMIEFKYKTILNRTNNIFELVTNKPVKEKPSLDKKAQLLLSQEEREVEVESRLRLKGQMIFMENWDMIMFLGTPVMPKLTSLISTGLYINDLSMHDFSRDLMLAGTQQSVELKLALDQEQQKSKKLEESMRKLDDEMKRTDELLYQMIPKQVADRLRRGESPVDTCEMFSSVSILFSDVVTFTEICSRITPMEVVSMLNAMYSIFDKLTEKNNVYKVETIGDAYMVVSGAPEKDMNHAERTCDMALDMIDAITDLKDPSTGLHLKIRVGIHSGAVVAGIVGLKMPRYCLFGDSVNTASRMESSSSPMKIHISQATKDALPRKYRITERGESEIKGKGSMKTFWLDSCDGRSPLTHPVITQMNIFDMSARKPAPIVSQPPLPTPPGTASTAVAARLSSGAIQRPSSGAVSKQSEVLRDPKYSPVITDEVLKNEELSRERRANSTARQASGTVSPSDLFGSLISDTEDFLDEVQRSSPQIFTPQTIVRPPSIPVKSSNLRSAESASTIVHENGSIRNRPQRESKIVDQLDQMVKNMDPNQIDLPGMMYTAASSSVTDGQLFKGILSRDPTHHHCYCYNYNNHVANSGYPYHKESQLPQCCHNIHSRQRMHSHACTLL